MASEDISALRQILEVKLDGIANSLNTLNAKIESIGAAQSADHDALIRAEMSIEQNVETLREHQGREAAYGLRTDERIDKIEKSVESLKLSVLKITTMASTAIAIIVWAIEHFLLK
jgi:hypothetical protein